MFSQSRESLLQAAETFCDAFAQQKPPEEILGHFSSSNDVRAFEHGLPKFAPFIGREFRGQGGIKNYFAYISSMLKYENMSFSDFVVDSNTSRVSCTGRARFIWQSTGQAWDETFAYLLGFDESFKVKSYEVWADAGALYLASKGQLGE